MINFNKFTIEQNLMDLEMKGAEFTWTNSQPNPIMCKLDFWTSREAAGL